MAVENTPMTFSASDISSLKRIVYPSLFNLDEKDVVNLTTAEALIKATLVERFFSRIVRRYRFTDIKKAIDIFRRREMKKLDVVMAYFTDIATNYKDLAKATGSLKNMELHESQQEKILDYEFEESLQEICSILGIRNADDLSVEEIWKRMENLILSFLPELQERDNISREEAEIIFGALVKVLDKTKKMVTDYMGSPEYITAVENLFNKKKKDGQNSSGQPNQGAVNSTVAAFTGATNGKEKANGAAMVTG